MIVLFTDFGGDDIYVGQVKAVLAHHAPRAPVVDLLHAAPAYDVDASAHLLAALRARFAPGSVFLAVVDPGVGSARQAVVLLADGYWFVGPDNGLLAVLAARAKQTQYWRIEWRPTGLSDTFHGRDLFAPIAAWIAAGQFPAIHLVQIPRLGQSHDGSDYAQIIYIDHYGNCFTGIQSANANCDATLGVAGARLPYARTFSEASAGQPFWYINSIGLVEIAVPSASAAEVLGLAVGDAVSWQK